MASIFSCSSERCLLARSDTRTPARKVPRMASAPTVSAMKMKMSISARAARTPNCAVPPNRVSRNSSFSPVTVLPIR